MQPIWRRILLITLFLLGIAWTWLSRVGGVTGTDEKISAPHVGFLAPNFSLMTIDGDTVELETLRGKPVIINFWASWCPPCRAEMPALAEAYLSFPGKIEILAIDATSQDSLEDVNEFLEDEPVPFPILLDDNGSVVRLYNVSSLPTSFFINKYGIITEVVIGGPMSEAGLRERIDSLLEETP